MPSLPLLGEGGVLVVFGAVFSTVTALNAVVIASSRVAFSMGRDGNFLRRFGQLHPRYGTPLSAVVASSVVMLAAIAFLPVRQVGNLSSLFFLLSFVVVNASAIRLRRERPDMRRPFEMPLYPLPPVLGIVCNLVLGAFIDPRTWLLGVGWLVVGGGAFVLVDRARGGGATGAEEPDHGRADGTESFPRGE
jgi:amino acid transporter